MRSESYVKWVHGGGVNGLVCAIVVLIWWIIAFGFGMTGVTIWWLVIGMPLGWIVGQAIGKVVLGFSGDSAQQIYAPSGSGSHVQSHSHIDALEVQEKFREAADAWEILVIEQPANPWPLIKSGELYWRKLNEPQIALVRFRLARDLPGIAPELQRYAMQKMIDVYLGPLGDEGRALVELRRMVELHSGTRDAEAARQAILAIKAGRNETPPA